MSRSDKNLLVSYKHSSRRVDNCVSTYKMKDKKTLYFLITPYIRMLDSDWLIAVIFFTNSGLAL